MVKKNNTEWFLGSNLQCCLHATVLLTVKYSAELNKYILLVRITWEKYHIYIYQWNWRIIKEICIKYNIYKYILLVSEGYLTVLETGILLK